MDKEQARLEKNKRIREAGIATRARRAEMDCRVYHLKIVDSSLNKKQREALKGVFQEYKWVRNSALANQRFDANYATELGSKVPVKTPSGIEDRELRFLGSQMKQAAVTDLAKNLHTLKALKNSGKRVGKLKFVRNIKSIELQQWKITYELFSANGRYTKARIQNIPGRLRVRGFEQLNREGIEFSNAKLVQKPSGYYLAVTCFIPKENLPSPTGKIGIDFGLKTSFVLSNGVERNLLVEETDALKRYQRKLARQEKGSNNWRKTRAKIACEHEKISSKRDELARQFVSEITQDNVVFFQDENIVSWKIKGRGSRKIQYGVLGRVKTLLRSKPNAVMLPKWVATTAWCPDCGNKTPHTPEKRVFQCSCGYEKDRDSHAAQNMVILGERYKKTTSGTEGSASGETVRLMKELYAPIQRVSAKLETATASESP